MHAKFRRYLSQVGPFVAVALAAVGGLVFDALTPEIIQVTPFYVPVVLAGYWFSQPKASLALLLLAAPLIVIGHWISIPSEIPAWEAWLNRGLSIGTVSLVAVFVWYVRDLQQQLHAMNTELALAKGTAEQANRSKSFFLANIGHELRTPLTAIIGFAEIIRDKILGNDLDRYAGYASDIYGSATHLLQLIGNLLDWSKIEAGKFELHEGFVNLIEIEEGCLHLVRGQAENCGVELVSNPTGSAISIHADETALKQILLNMLSNAIKFTPKGGSVWLSHSFEPDGTFALTVTDTGVGMTEAEIKQALEPFQQVQNPLTRHREGTGLGLPLAAQLMVLHGGSLTIKSHPGQGSAVLVHFPAWRVNPDRECSTLPKDGDAPGPKKITRPARKH